MLREAEHLTETENIRGQEMNLEKTVQQWVEVHLSRRAMAVTMIFVSSRQSRRKHRKAKSSTPNCERTIKADVVAFDQPFFYNRLGAVNPAGMIYALRARRETEVRLDGLVPGNVRLKKYKRARPIVLRMNIGDCIQILFQNLLDPNRADDNQPATRTASIHVVGLQLKNSILDDGSNVGTNPSSLVAPGNSITYTLYARKRRKPFALQHRRDNRW